MRAEHIEFRLVTNTSSKSRVRIAELLSQAGIDVDVGEIQTAVSSAASYLTDTYPGARCLFLNEGDTGDDLEGVTLVDAGDVANPAADADAAADAEVILLGGAGPSLTYGQLDAVFKRAMDGVPLMALHRNTRFQTDRGPALDMGAFIVGLEDAASVEVTVVGKPAATFFRSALAGLGAVAPTTCMVGDDLVSDVLGAQAVGIIGILVRTGKFRPADLDGADGRPDHVLDGIGELPSLLDRLG
jgi:HAD superfamily hydrolase (TIGR01458 family)